MTRKSFLRNTVISLFLLGLALSSIPFIYSLFPSPLKIKPLDIDISKIPEDTFKIFIYDHTLVAFYKPSDNYYSKLVSLNDIAKPKYEISEKPAFYLYQPLGTYTINGRCVLKESFKLYEHNSFTPIEGLFDPCDYGYWDYSGRYIKDRSSNLELRNLREIKKYRWLSDSTLRIEDNLPKL